MKYELSWLNWKASNQIESPGYNDLWIYAFMVYNDLIVPICFNMDDIMST